MISVSKTLEMASREAYLHKVEAYNYHTGRYHVPKPPYKIEEVPKWYPDNLKKYLINVSREYWSGALSNIIPVPDDPSISIEDYVAPLRADFEREIENMGGIESFYAMDIENDPDVCMNEIMHMHQQMIELEVSSILLTIRDLVFTKCDLRTGRVYTYHDEVLNECGLIEYCKTHL